MVDAPVILVVEDDVEMNELQRELLAIHGIDSLPAYSGKEAVELFSQKHIDGILLDLMMPEMDGFEACRCIRKISTNPGLPIIMITAMGAEASTQEGYEAGVDAFFVKPFSPAKIVETLQTLLKKNKSENS